jgi:acyl-CoA synthetase (AMP-forming)/AMP-acid ligase II
MTQTRDDLFEWGTTLVLDETGSYPRQVYDNRRTSMCELLLDARRWRGRDLIRQGERTLSYAGLEPAVAATAERLAEAGVVPGSVVLLSSVNSIEWVIAFWAVLARGACAALGNFWWSPGELAGAVEDLKPVLVIADAPRLPLVPGEAAAFAIEDVDTTGRAGSDHLILPDVGEDDPALIVFTSGSTGRPKGAVLSHRGVIAAHHHLLLRTRRLPQMLDADGRQVVSLLTSPLFHLGGVGPLITATIVGGKVVFLAGKFDAREVLELIQTERVTVWGGVPTTMQRVLALPDIGSYDTSSLRTVGLGGAPVPPGLLARVQAVFPKVTKGVSEVYGMTETNGLVASAAGRVLDERPGTAGQPMPGVEVRIKDPDANGDGEILVRGPTVMLGYAGEPRDASLDGEGFFATGDVGRVDAEGYLYVTGRAKDVIIRGGENIAAVHVEEALAGHPLVREVAVVGIAHEDLGEEVGAAVVVAGELRGDDLRAYLTGKIAYFEIPTRWRLTRDDLPTTPFGKIDKKQLKRKWTDVAEAG